MIAIPSVRGTGSTGWSCPFKDRDVAVNAIPKAGRRLGGAPILRGLATGRHLPPPRDPARHDDGSWGLRLEARPGKGRGSHPGKPHTTRITTPSPSARGSAPADPTRTQFAHPLRAVVARVGRSSASIGPDHDGTPAPGPSRPTRGRTPVRVAPRVVLRERSPCGMNIATTARRPDRHDGRRDPRRPGAPRLPGHLVRPLPADAAGRREARREGLSRQTGRHRPLARPEPATTSKAVPTFIVVDAQGKELARTKGAMPAGSSSPRSTTSQAQGRLLEPGRGGPGTSRNRGSSDPSHRRRPPRWSIPSPGRPSSGSRCTSPTASGVTARARSSTARPTSRSS